MQPGAMLARWVMVTLMGGIPVNGVAADGTGGRVAGEGTTVPAEGSPAGATLLRSTLGEAVHNIAQANEAAQWLSTHGEHEDGAAATSAAGRLSEELAQQMCSHGLRAIETATHRATLTSYMHGGEEHRSALVVRRGVDDSGRRGVRTSREQIEDKATADPESSHPDRPAHNRLCPLGGGGTRWYACALHEPRVIFQAGSGLYDSIANSCPRCGRLGASYTGCACEAAARPVNRRRQRRRVRMADAAPYLPSSEGDSAPSGSIRGDEAGCP